MGAPPFRWLSGEGGAFDFSNFKTNVGTAALGCPVERSSKGLGRLLLIATRFLFCTLFLIAALRRQFPRYQEGPLHFIRIQILAGFPDRLVRFILFPTGPRIPRALHAVQNDLRILLAAVVGIDLRFHSTFSG